MNTFQPNWASKPGNTILDILEERNVSIEAFSERMQQPVDYIQQLLDGDVSITEMLASQLTDVLGASEQFWLNRQQQYHQQVCSIKRQVDESWLKDIPVEEMIKFGWIKETDDRLNACLDFFGVRDAGEWRSKYAEEVCETVNFRTSPTFQSQLGPLASWLRQGEVIGNSLSCKPWDSAAFEASLLRIRQLTTEKSPKRFLPKLREICAQSGVAIAVVRTPKGCKASGATRFLPSNRALLMLSFRYLSDDQFWFTFFHEAGHLLLHENKGLYLEGIGSELGVSEINSRIQRQEEEANAFAGEMLIPYGLHQDLRKLQGNKRSIISFAMAVGVSPGIVVGQMQHHGYIKRSYLNSFKRRYDWDDILSAE